MMRFHNSGKVGAYWTEIQCYTKPFGGAQDKLREESMKTSKTRRFFVVPPMAILLRMTGKNRFSGWTLAGFVLIGCFVLLVGCLGKGTQKPTEFYLLQTLKASMEGQGVAGGQGTVLAIGPVRVREYLNRFQIVTRTSTNEIRVHDFHYWGESLSNNFTAVLAQNLSVLLSTDRVLIFPYRSKRELPADYQIVVDVIRFDGEPGVEATLITQYYILALAENDGKQIVTRQSSFTKPLADKTFDTLVATMSELVGDFSREIAEQIEGASR